MIWTAVYAAIQGSPAHRPYRTEQQPLSTGWSIFQVRRRRQLEDGARTGAQDETLGGRAGVL